MSPVRYYVTLLGQERVVDITEDADGVTSLVLDGRPVEGNLVELHGGSLHSLLLDGTSREMVLEREGDRVVVFLDGERIEATVRDEVSRALASVLKAPPPGPSVIEAPMPGIVVSVPVKIGDVVAIGQAIVVVEAMKMQNELLAESEGIVDSIDVEPGQAVDRGTKLVRLRALDSAEPKK